MANLTPTWRDGQWSVDLRTPWNLGRRTVDAPPPPHGLTLAIHAAYALFERLRAERGLTDAQLLLPGTSGRTFGQALDAFLKEKKWKSAGGKKWGTETCALLHKELGQRPLVLIDVDALWAYRDETRKRVGAKTMEGRLIMLGQILAWAVEPPRKWLPFAPPMPSPKLDETEDIKRALTKWVDEGTFRVARDCIYQHQTARNGLSVELAGAGKPHDAAAVWDLICQRKLYLSFAFYTGMRRHDLDEITDAYLSVDMGCYFRHGRKTGVDVAAEAIPAPFVADIAQELRRLGRPWRSGELIAGGPWKNVCRVLDTACQRAEVERFNLMDCRRSFAYHKALAGIPVDELANLMGHKDSRMLKAVYLQLQPRLQRDEAGAAWPKALTALPGTGSARVIPFGK